MSTHRKQGNQGKQEQNIGTRKTETLERNDSQKKSPRTETTCDRFMEFQFHGDRVGKLDITLHRKIVIFFIWLRTHIVGYFNMYKFGKCLRLTQICTFYVEKVMYQKRIWW